MATKDLPNKTKEIYEKLNKGDIISDNNVSKDQVNLFLILDENFEILKDYFSHLGLILEKGNGFFYFSKNNSKAQIETKIEQAFKWIDLLDFFKAFRQDFSSGFRFSISELAEAIRVEAGLEEKLEKISKYSRNQKGRIADDLRSITKQLEESGPFIQMENEITETYKVLSSIRYLEELMLKIEISDTEE